jgi:PIN domain-containing protein
MPPNGFTIFLDENHCNNQRLLDVLKEADVPVVRHLAHFSRGTPDEDWLQIVGKSNWALLTSDARIRYRTNEKRAVQENNVRMFYFSTNNLSGLQMAGALKKALPRMKGIFQRQKPPYCAAITRSGEVHVRETFSSVL